MTAEVEEKLDDGTHSRSRVRRRLWYSVIVVDAAFVLNFTAYQSMQNLQSSLNVVEGLGTAGLAVVYAALVLSALTLPPLVIGHLGCKWTIALCFLPYALFMAANLYASWWTIMPAAALMGTAAAPLWAAKCTYLTNVAHRLASLSSTYTFDVYISRLFGLFFMAFQTSQIWGNLISGLILQERFDNANVSAPENGMCGIAYCPDNNANGTNIKQPSPEKVYTLCVCYIILSLLASLLVMLGVDCDVTACCWRVFDCCDKWAPDEEERKKQPCCLPPITDQGHGQGGKTKEGSRWRLLLLTVRQWRLTDQLLIIPITIFSGLVQAFFAGDFTVAYVSCSLGIWMVGFVVICFGVTDSLSSLLFGYITKFLGRPAVFAFGACVQCGAIVWLLLWRHSHDVTWTYFVVAALWGLSDGIWQTQINALYGTMFAQSAREAAFANYRLWESVGFILAFAYSAALCVRVKVLILAAALLLGLAGYFTVELRHAYHRVHSRAQPATAS